LLRKIILSVCFFSSLLFACEENAISVADSYYTAKPSGNGKGAVKLVMNNFVTGDHVRIKLTSTEGTVTELTGSNEIQHILPPGNYTYTIDAWRWTGNRGASDLGTGTDPFTGSNGSSWDFSKITGALSIRPDEELVLVIKL
jgi:hypothetical protein